MLFSQSQEFVLHFRARKIKNGRSQPISGFFVVERGRGAVPPPASHGGGRGGVHGEVMPVVHGGGDRGLRGGVLLPVRGGEPVDAGIREAAVGGGAEMPGAAEDEAAAEAGGGGEAETRRRGQGWNFGEWEGRGGNVGNCSEYWGGVK